MYPLGKRKGDNDKIEISPKNIPNISSHVRDGKKNENVEQRKRR